jgi:AraC-like DNA-binding protein
MPEYLSKHRVLRTGDLDESRVAMAKIWGDHTARPTTRMPFATAVNHARIGRAGLTFLNRPTPLLIESQSNCHCYSIGFHDTGACQHKVDGQTVVSTPDTAVIWSPGRDLQIVSEGQRLLSLSLPRRGVEEGLHVHGLELSQGGQATPSIDPTSGSGSALRSLCRWAAREVDKPDTPLTSGPAAHHLEETLLTLFLQSLVRHMPPTAARYGDMLGRIKLSDLESWIEANLCDPISVETLASIAGVTPRAVQMAFRRHRDCTPLEFVRDARLRRIRQEILLHGPEASLTEIALDHGFLHLGRFALAYRRLFGERPSDTRQGSRATPRRPADG